MDDLPAALLDLFMATEVKKAFDSSSQLIASGDYQEAIDQADKFLDIIKDSKPESNRKFAGTIALLYGIRAACYEALANGWNSSFLQNALSDCDHALTYIDLMDNRYETPVVKIRDGIVSSRANIVRQLKALGMGEPEKKWWQFWN